MTPENAGADSSGDTTTSNIDPPVNDTGTGYPTPSAPRPSAPPPFTHKPYVPPTPITVDNAGRIKGLEAPLG